MHVYVHSIPKLQGNIAATSLSNIYASFASSRLLLSLSYTRELSALIRYFESDWTNSSEKEKIFFVPSISSATRFNIRHFKP